MGEIHELFVLALSLVWFAGATPEIRQNAGEANGTLDGTRPLDGCNPDVPPNIFMFIGFFLSSHSCDRPGSPRAPKTHWVMQERTSPPTSEFTKSSLFFYFLRMIRESLRGNRIGATGLRASERKSASERVSERQGFDFWEVFRGF